MTDTSAHIYLTFTKSSSPPARHIDHCLVFTLNNVRLLQHAIVLLNIVPRLHCLIFLLNNLRRLHCLIFLLINFIPHHCTIFLLHIVTQLHCLIFLFITVIPLHCLIFLLTYITARSSCKTASDDFTAKAISCHKSWLC